MQSNVEQSRKINCNKTISATFNFPILLLLVFCSSILTELSALQCVNMGQLQIWSKCKIKKCVLLLLLNSYPNCTIRNCKTVIAKQYDWIIFVTEQVRSGTHSILMYIRISRDNDLHTEWKLFITSIPISSFINSWVKW